jgi:phosphoserine phosphatase
VGAALGIGTRPEVVDGRLTGRIEGTFCYREGKLARIAEELGGVPFELSAAYADSGSDLPLLRTCSRAVAVNPDRSLLRAAREAAWPILRFA